MHKIAPSEPETRQAGNIVSSLTKHGKPVYVHKYPRVWWFMTYYYDNPNTFERLKEKCAKCAILTHCAFQDEVCPTTGRVHLQGCFKFSKKQYASWFQKDFPDIWLAPAGGTEAEARAYCTKLETHETKEDRYVKGWILAEDLRIVYPDYTWQQEILKLINEPVDHDAIYWYWERAGGVGKSELVKYLCHEHHGLMCSGKSADMKYLYCAYKDQVGSYPKLVIMDIPRSNLRYVNYTGLEEIKNGCFSSTKYECKMAISNRPHFFCFANSPPDWEELSPHKWKVFEIVGKHEPTKISTKEKVNEVEPLRLRQY